MSKLEREFPGIIRSREGEDLLQRRELYAMYHEYLRNDAIYIVPLGLLLEDVKLARQMNDRNELSLIYRKLREYLSTYLDARRLRAPSALAIEVLSLARQFRDTEFLNQLCQESIRWARFNEEIRSLDAFDIQLVKFASESDGEGLRREIYQYYRHYLSERRIETVNSTFIVGMIKLARQLRDGDGLGLIYRDCIQRRKIKIASLPLEAFRDLRWLAQEFRDEKLLRDLDWFVASAVD